MKASSRTHGGTRVRRGSLLFLRLLRLADRIDLAGAARSGDGRRARLRRQVSSALVDAALPLDVELGTLALPPELGAQMARTRARLFSFGIVSIVVEVPIADVALAALSDVVATSRSATALDAHARTVATDLVQRFRTAMSGASVSGPIEDYTIVLLREVDGDLMDDRDALTHVLLAEPGTKPLAAALQDEVLARPHRWFEDDLVLLHYEVAVVLEPEATADLAAVIELALTQLLEFRARDAQIDAELQRVYAELARSTDRGWWLSGTSSFRRARDAMRRLVELAELADSADNVTKFAADLYLASLYLDALERFRVNDWRTGVQRKLGLFTRTYELLKSEGDVRRSLVLEATMVILVLIEVIIFLVSWRA